MKAGVKLERKRGGEECSGLMLISVRFQLRFCEEIIVLYFLILHSLVVPV